MKKKAIASKQRREKKLKILNLSNKQKERNIFVSRERL